ncbi:unnamed protein product [Auanema sp. JU1783]|nr:unnamed protein product [Auanema sp. JU1783]
MFTVNWLQARVLPSIVQLLWNKLGNFVSFLLVNGRIEVLEDRMASQLFIYVSHVVPFFILWIALLFPLSKYELPWFWLQHVLQFLPVYAVLLLGVYAAGSVIHGVATFNDCVAARNELVVEIKEARDELIKKKIIS